MDTTQQYALHDGDAGGTRQWVAHVRLTPELLQRLQQNPSSVSIRLQAPSSGSSAASRAGRSGNAKTSSSVLIIDGGDSDEPETYELLSFTEDPKVNSVYAFRPDPLASAPRDASGEEDPQDAGYSLFEIGRVHQKLIVQRMLDSTEKDRMKDRHAKSVLESKARSSKLVETTETGPTRGRSKTPKPYELKGVVLPYPPGKGPPSTPMPAAAIADEPPVKRRMIPSALTPAAAEKLRDRMSQRPEAPDSVAETKQADSDAPLTKIFSSDSEVDNGPGREALLANTAESKTPASKPASQKKAARKAASKREPTIKTATKAPTSTAPQDTEAAAQAKAPERPRTELREAPAETKATEPIEVASQAIPTTETASGRGEKRKADGDEQETVDPPAVQSLPPVKATKSEVKKRARPRLSRLPDISFLPQSVQDICRRVSAHITRTAILDANDYESFAAEHDRLRADWEELDKAYSIESILIDGAHFQLPFAESEEERRSLQATILESEKKQEGLGFVRDSMATIHKILASLQGSITVYERKTRQQS